MHVTPIVLGAFASGVLLAGGFGFFAVGSGANDPAGALFFTTLMGAGLLVVAGIWGMRAKRSAGAA